MTLTIKKNHGLYSVSGTLNSVSAQYFQTFFENILEESEDLTIDIENLIDIDEAGINAIRVLYNNARNFERGFLVIGRVSQHILESIRSIKIAA